jgi:hypothetical protein
MGRRPRASHRRPRPSNLAITRLVLAASVPALTKGHCQRLIRVRVADDRRQPLGALAINGNFMAYSYLPNPGGPLG